MAMDSYVNGVTNDFDRKVASSEGVKVSAPKDVVKSENGSEKEGEKDLLKSEKTRNRQKAR